jgi:DNA mismatch repair protein MutL
VAAIRLLPPGLVNRIAAGEVVERPASVVKELIENALDAGAGRIEVQIDDGGRSRIRVGDDGCGMDGDALALAVQRHATSKLDGEDLVRIRTLGFRGEALPSIGAVARLGLTSRTAGCAHAWQLSVEGGEVSAPRPAAGPRGTRVEVRDLFFATPARLKFLRTAQAEGRAAQDVVRRLAMAHPGVAFRLLMDGREVLRLEPDGALARIGRLLGRGFGDEAIALDALREGIRLFGLAGLPTQARTGARHQYLFVNGRPVEDRLLKGALRAAYTDLVFHDRQPVVALFLDVPPERVDVNVHPAKAEVRFREPETVRGLLVGALKRALAEHGHRTAPELGRGALGLARPFGRQPSPGLAETASAFQAPLGLGAPRARPTPAAEPDPEHPLGAARAQLHDAYIIAQTRDGLVIVDQHAAHERIVYERLKQGLADGGVPGQGLLVPEIVELEDDACERLLARREELAGLGLVVEPFGKGAVAVRATPALLGAAAAAGLVRDLAEDLVELDAALSLEEALERVAATMACHGSVRAGRRLRQEEMDALLRQMEATPHAGQCNHGRPTYVLLKREDIERLFGRR